MWIYTTAITTSSHKRCLVVRTFMPLSAIRFRVGAGMSTDSPVGNGTSTAGTTPRTHQVSILRACLADVSFIFTGAGASAKVRNMASRQRTAPTARAG